MIHAILNNDVVHALETLFAVSVLILIVLMLRRAVSRQFGAGIVYLLWAIPVARFFLPPLPTPVSILNFGTAAPEAVPVVAEGINWVAVPAAPVPAVLFEPADIAMTEDVQPLLSADALLPALITAGIAAWIAGAVFLMARGLYAHWRFMQTVDREAMPVSAPMADLVDRIAAETGLSRPPRLVASLISRGPFVTGLFRPVIVMPAWFEDDYTPTEARAALAHELMHVRRGDLWALQVSELFVAAMWFNPLAYIARNAFRTDQEAACDADVLARCQTSPHAYGSTLIKAAKLHLPEPAIATGRLPLTHALKERLTRMTYPAPSSRRRMIGFGAALLFGVSTLAITSSVAAAGEPKDGEVKEIRIDSNTLWIDGEAADRQIVMLGDPMAKVMPVPPEPPELAELHAKITADSVELSNLYAVDVAIDMVNDPDFMEITRLSTELGLLGAELGVMGASEALRMDFAGMSEDEIEEWSNAFEARMEAKAAMIEARAAEMETQMEHHGAMMEARFADQERMDADTERRAAVIERRMERHGAEIERIMEQRFGADFEKRIEGQAAVVAGLVEACENAELAKGETRVIERKDPEGETFRLACIEGDRANMASAKALAAIDSHPGITAAEKAAFKAAAQGERRKNVMIFRSGAEGLDIDMDIDVDVETPEPPAQPAQPPQPSAPDLDGE
jgi:beta-lactamase regulating signal transducer with metallopeptidase domain